MKTRKHVILDHPVLGYFLLMIMVSVLESVASSLDSVIAGFLPGYGTEMEVFGTKIMNATGVGVAAGAMAAVGIFCLWFRPELKGILKKEGIKAGLLMLLPFLIFHYTGSIVSWITYGTVGASGILIMFLRAFAPGFGEEIMFRGLGVANYMRTIKSESQIKVIFWLSSIVFGLVHAANILAGGDPFSVALQTVYAIGVGMLFCAVYLRTGNLWPTIIGHLSVDFLEFVRADPGSSGGLMMHMGIGDWITIAAGAFAAVWGLRLIAPKYYPDIMAVWDRTWSRDQVSSKNGQDASKNEQDKIGADD